MWYKPCWATILIKYHWSSTIIHEHLHTTCYCRRIPKYHQLISERTHNLSNRRFQPAVQIITMAPVKKPAAILFKAESSGLCTWKKGIPVPTSTGRIIIGKRVTYDNIKDRNKDNQYKGDKVEKDVVRQTMRAHRCSLPRKIVVQLVICQPYYRLSIPSISKRKKPVCIQ